jgi:polyisoprenoid-binding protein YceI
VGAAALLAAVSIAFVAHAKLSKVGTPTAGFHAKGPAGLAIDGKTSDVDVVDDGTNITVTVRHANIDTGMEIRNKHTKEDLEADRFATASLKVPLASLKLGGGEEDAKGSLTIHGQTKDVTFHYKASKSGNTLDVKGATTINVNDFGVKPRSYMGVSIKNDVEIFAAFQVQ